VLPNQKTSGFGEYWRGEEVKEHLTLTQYQTILPTFLRLLPRQGRILDAGCGLGRWLIYLWDLGYTIQGMDVSADALKAIRDYNKSIPLCQGDVESAPFVNTCFDAIISLGVIEHFEADPSKALREAHRLLKEDGILLLTVPYQNLIRRLIYSPFILLVGRWWKLLGRRRQFMEYRFSKNEITDFVKQAGFQVLHVEADDFTPPKSLGIYSDWSWCIGNRDVRWELNTVGKILMRFLGLFPLWLYCSGILVVARK